MKKLLFTIAFLFITTFTFAQSSVYVSGYTNSYGTYVKPHYRSAPNKTVKDNYSTKGNTNPYTGKVGTKSFYSNYSAPTYSYPSSSTYKGKSVSTGPRGGRYYINSNGNKTYIKN